MLRTTKRHRQPLEIMAAMNITNMLDTAFILLIAMMVVLPRLGQGIKLDLPEVKASTMEQKGPKTLLISVAKQQEGEAGDWIYLDGKRVTLEQIQSMVAQARQGKPDISVLIEADKASLSGTFVEVIAAVKNAGVNNIGISTAPERTRKEKDDLVEE